MNKLRRVLCLVMCMVLFVCLLSPSVSAVATPGSCDLRSSFGNLATARASVEVTNEDGTATLYYDAMASTMTIRLNLQEQNDSNGSLAWKTKLETAANTSNLFVYKIAGSNTTIVAGYAILTITTTLDSHEFNISDPID